MCAQSGYLRNTVVKSSVINRHEKYKSSLEGHPPAKLDDTDPGVSLDEASTVICLRTGLFYESRASLFRI